MKNAVFVPFRCCLFTVLFVLASRFAAADVIHVTTPISIAAGNTAVLNWDVDEDGIVEFSISYSDQFAVGGRVVNDPDNPVDPLNAGALIARDAGGAQSGEFIAVNLPSGFLISGTLPGDLTFSQDVLPLTTIFDALFGLAGFQENTPGYIGFSFPRIGTSPTGPTSTTLYGWAKLTVIPDEDGNGDPILPGLTISEWAYETTGGFLSVPVPEPSITAFLTLGTCGLIFRKRRSIRGLVGFRRGTDVPEGA